MENKGYYLYYSNDKISIRYSATQGQYKTLAEANAAIKVARRELAEYNAKAFNYKGLLA